MSKSIAQNRDKMEKLRKDSNPKMADIDAMVNVFGNYEKSTSTDYENLNLGQKAYLINS
jgi:hypothetical protein